MKKITILNFLFLFIFHSSVFAELILDQDFPLEMQGIWSENCNSDNNTNALIIYDYGTLFIRHGNDSYVSLNISKTTNYNSWRVYEWIIDGNKEKYFLKLQNGKLIEKYPPLNWNEIDYEFLTDSTSPFISSYEKCESIPPIIRLFYDPIISFSKSEVPALCYNFYLKEENIRKKCKVSLLKYLDISKDMALSSAEITRGIKLLVFYIYMNSADNIKEEIVPFSKLLSFTFVPTLSQLFLLNYDFDNSKTLSMEEFKFAYFDLDQGKKVLNNNYNNLNIPEIIDNITDILDR